MTMTLFLAIAGAVLGAASMLLHVIAPLTTNTVDDSVEDVVDKVLSYLGQHNPATGAPAEVASNGQLTQVVQAVPVAVPVEVAGPVATK